MKSNDTLQLTTLFMLENKSYEIQFESQKKFLHQKFVFKENLKTSNIPKANAPSQNSFNMKSAF